MRKGYINADIYKSSDTAFLVDDNTIVLTGTDERIRKLLTKDEEIIDLQGMMVVPGFMDTHMHLLSLGEYLYNVRLDGAKSLDEIRTRIKAFMSNPKMKGRISGKGYNDDLFTVPGKPDKAFLDSITQEYPVTISRACGHMMIANSKALAEAGITEDITIEGGRILFDQGIVEENCIAMMKEARPAASEELMEAYITEAAAFCAKYGITTVGSDDLTSMGKDWRPVLNVLERMSFQETLNVRINEQCRFASEKEFASFLDEGYTTDVGNDFFRIGPLKLICDGSLGARTAALSRPYADAPEQSGYMCMSEDDIRLYAELAAKFNMPTICHAIGDEAVDTVLRVLKDTIYEGNPLHSGLVHCQILRPEQIRRIIDLKLSCYIQTLFVDYDATIVKQRTGSLADSSYPYASLYRGTLCSNGSDSPVEMPDALKGIQLAVTRKSTHADACMDPSECLTVEEAIDSYTSKAAEQFFMNDRVGQIKAGMYADFVVLDQNLLHCDPETIKDTKVMMTVMNGKTVFER